MAVMIFLIVAMAMVVIRRPFSKSGLHGRDAINGVLRSVSRATHPVEQPNPLFLGYQTSSPYIASYFV